MCSKIEIAIMASIWNVFIKFRWHDEKLTQGSGKCYLPKMTGSCDGDENNFYFDKDAEKCKEFKYGGCLGNTNRFETMQECQESCLGVSDDVAICAQPYEPGPCRYIISAIGGVS